MRFFKYLIDKVGSVYILLIIATLLGKFLGLGREAVIAYRFGASHVFDVYLVVSVVPAMIASLFIYAIPHIIIPRIGTINDENRINKIKEYNSYFFWSFTILNIVISLVYFLLSPFISKLLLPNIGSVDLVDAIYMSRIFSVYILFAIQFSLFKTFYSSNRKFILPAYTQLITHISVISTVYLFANKLSTFSLLVGLVIGVILQVLVLIVNLNKLKILKYFKFEVMKYKGLTTSIIIIIFIEFLGQTYSFINRSFFDSLPNGYIGAIHYAGIINNLPIAIFAMTLGSIVFPTISEYIKEKKIIELKRLVLITITKLLIIVIPIALILFFFSDVVVRILLQRGAFGEQATVLTASMLMYLAVGLPFVMIHTVLAKIMFAMKKEMCFLYITLFGVAIKYFFTLWFVKIQWFYGIAFSTSLVYVFTVVLLLVFILRRNNKYEI